MPPAKSRTPATTTVPSEPVWLTGTPTAAPVTLDTPEAIAAYQNLYDTLGRAYWEASDIDAKDRIQGARDAIYEILTDLNIAKLEDNTALLLTLAPKIKHTNEALEKIKDDIAGITRNITTAATVVAAITRALSIAAMF